jgi:triosephosphate isomerase
MRRLFVAGNWKMNTTLASGRELAAALAKAVPTDLAKVEVAVCPPFPYLSAVGAVVAGSAVQLGAQTASHENLGAFTGEVAVEMLKEVGCRWVILGHSERRQYQSESDELISRKARKVLDTGLSVILCVGESLSQRQANQMESVLDSQMAGSLAGIAEADLDHMVIAYEPVWAIGTGVTATTEQAEAAHRHLRTWLAKRYNPAAADRVRILYGGSVKGSNALSLLGQPNVDGALVGGASLKVDDFLPIIRAAEAVTKS